MSTIVTRAGKGSPLTNNEVDSNFTNLNSDKVETVTSVDGSVVLSRVGTTVDFSVGINASTGNLIAAVRNETGATLTKGTVVYPAGASGNKMLVQKALATSDATSAQTYGMIQADIPNNQNGFVVVSGLVSGLNTLGLVEGGILYLSPTTAGGYTQTKPYAPNHLVYVGIVTRVHATQGEIQTRIQNGYELDEIHDVQITSIANNDILQYDSASSLWKNVTPATARTNLGLAIGTNVQAWDVHLDQIAALNPTADNFVVGNGTSWILETPAQARTSLGATTVGGNMLTLTNPSAITFPRFNADNTISTLDAATFRAAIGAGTSSTTGTVTSVGGTGTVSGLTLTGTVTTTGNLTLGGTLAVTASNFASQTANTFLAAPNGAAGTPTFRAIVAADIPTLNQNTTGSSGSCTGNAATASTASALSSATWQRITGNAIDYGSYGSIGVSGSTNSYAGISFSAVSGTLMMQAAATGFYYSNSTWRVYWDGSGNQINTGNVTAYSSDERLKYNIKPILNARKLLRQVEGVYFDWDLEECNKWNFFPPAHDMGLLAQRVQKINPYAVHPAPFDHDPLEKGKSKSGKDYLTVQYEKMVPMLIQSSNEHDELIDQMQERIAKLEALVANLVNQKDSI